jgi:acyl-[acyl-carrier-protein]-phospholipid O-acyltransferase / long-chain-fatty-acid--[acyl-carrier-protein] ligase
MENKQRLSLPCLLLASAQVGFNDNAARFMLVGLAQAVLPQEHAAMVVSALAVILILPFVILAPVVGWISDRYPKQKVLNVALILQIGVMLWISAAIASRQLSLAIVGFALLSIQACLFSPAKQGILKELVGVERLGVAAGWMGSVSVLAILLGMVTGGLSFDRLATATGDPWKGALLASWFLTAGAVAAWLIFLGVRRTESQSSEAFSPKILVSHFTYIRDLWREPALRLAALGIAFFWAFGGVINLSVIQIGRDLHHGQIGSVSISVLLLFIIGVGMAAGSLAAAAFCRKRIELGLVPIGAVGLMVAILVAGLAPLESAAFKPALFLLGFFAGLFTIPLNAYLQARAEDSRRGRIIAALTLLVDAGGLAAIGLQYVLAETLHLTPPQQFLVMALPSLAVACYVLWLLPESLLRLAGVIIASCIYRVRAIGVENLPKTGGVLLISNHVTYVDAVVLQMACPRPIRFVAYEGFHKTWWLGWALRILGVIPISTRHAKDAVRSIADFLKRGEVVCIFPEGQLTRTGTLQGLRKGFELMAREGQAPVVPVYLDALWGSIFSYSDRRFFWKRPERWPYGALVNFGKPVPAEEARTMEAWRALLDLGEESFELRPDLEEHLGYAAIKSLGTAPWKTLIIDRLAKRRMSRGMILALALALAQRWRAIPGRRVGVVLPPGVGGTAANLALVLAGKIPVNLNFTSGRAALESCLRRAEIQAVISAEVLRKKIADFPWPAQTIDVAGEIQNCDKLSLAGWLLAVWLLPARMIASLARVPLHGNREEAALLFTSGSSGEPKGVILSHRNIIGNVSQFAATNVISRGDTLLGSLPLFHSFGFTVTLWYPILRGVRTAALPSPLETQKIGETVHDERVTVLLSTPTFLRAYLRKIDADRFGSLRMIVAGAEKLPEDLARSFQEKFKVPIMEGYGLTETSPAVSVNIPDPTGSGVNPGTRAGSVGRLIPGMTARIVDPETQRQRSLFETGMLHLRGPNIFNGYLGDEKKTKEVLQEGWFITGDLARFDEDGFLFIEGRLSRFSKIGGEMVPHGTVEESVLRALGLEESDALSVAVVGVPDEAKGEALVLLTTADIAPDALREKLSAAGLPNLWIPKIVRRVERIPALATGKLDLKGCQALAAS